VLATAAARRAVMLVLAVMAWVENMATAISAADKIVSLVICFLHKVKEANRSAARQLFFTGFQRGASSAP
jgi:voltage-gated potassium channel Kch